MFRLPLKEVRVSDRMDLLFPTTSELRVTEAVMLLKRKKKILKKPDPCQLPFFHSYKVRLSVQISCPLLQEGYF